MQARTLYENSENSARLIDTNSLRAYLNLGRDSAIRFGIQSGARVQCGKRVLWDRQKIDSYLDSLTGE